MKTLYHLIARQPLFRGMNREHLCWLAENARQTWFEADEFIFRDGDVANCCYLLVNGEVSLELSGNGRTLPLQTVGPGEPLGWSWLFLSHISLACARATEPTEVVFFYGTHLRELCVKDGSLGCELFRRVAEVTMQRLQATRRLLWAQHFPGAADCLPGGKRSPGEPRP